MSGMYNILFGDGHEADRGSVFVTIFDIEGEAIPRFRDCWIELRDDGSLVFHVYTRVGGNNREEYADEIQALQNHPQYLHDEDSHIETNSGVDTTYASFYFLIPVGLPSHMADAGYSPEQYREVTAKMRETASEPIDMNQMWEEKLTAWENKQFTERDKSVIDQLGGRMQEVVEAGGGVITVGTDEDNFVKITTLGDEDA